MIYIKSIRNVKYDEHDEVWAIVRSLKSKSNKLKQVQALSPSLNLFFKYQNLAKAGQWNKQTFHEIYVPQFIKELKENDKETYAYLNELYFADKTGKNICLVCFCPNETMCHRSIIAGLLQGVGCNVQTEQNANYTKYYELFKETGQNTIPENKIPSFRDEFYFLSNMYPCPVTVYINNQNMTFTCAESAYQAYKCPEKAIEFTQLNGYDAKKLSYKIAIREDWNEMRLPVMKCVLKAKYTQNPDLTKRLKTVHGTITERNIWNDTFWGTYNGIGENQLGKLLMQIRDEL